MNDVVVLNDAIVARFAKGERAQAALVHERAILVWAHIGSRCKCCSVDG